MGRAARPSPGQKKHKNSSRESTIFSNEESFCALLRFMMCTFREFEVNLSVELFLYYVLPVI